MTYQETFDKLQIARQELFELEQANPRDEDKITSKSIEVNNLRTYMIYHSELPSEQDYD